MSGRAKVVAYLLLLAAGLAGAAVAIPWLESRRTLNLLQEQDARFDVLDNGTLAWMTLPPDRTTDETLLLLRGNSRLLHLSLKNCAITDAGLRNLGTLEHLTILDLSGTQRLHHGLEAVRGYAELEELRLAGCPWVDDDELDCLTRCPRLTALDLSGTPVSDAAVEHLLQLDRLVYLNLSGCPNITDDGARRLLELPNLLQLNLQGASISIPCWKQLSAIRSRRLIYCPVEHLPAFEPLHQAGGSLLAPPSGTISFGITGPHDPDLLAPLGELETLTTLRICDAPVDDDDLQWLTGLNGLQRADLSGTNASDMSVAALADSPLTVVNLSGTRITDRGLSHLARVTTLQELRLRQTEVQGGGFAPFSESHHLTYLDLQGSALTDAGAANLARLPALTWLMLADTSVTDAGLASLGAAPALSSLDVDGTPIRGEGLAGLSRAKTIHSLSLKCDQLDEQSLRHLERFESLTSLSLGTTVGDRGVRHLTRVSGLKSLSLSGTRLTPGMIPHLNNITELESLTIRDEASNAVVEALADVRGLETLILSHCEYDENAVHALRTARPDLRIDSWQ